MSRHALLGLPLFLLLIVLAASCGSKDSGGGVIPGGDVSDTTGLDVLDAAAPDSGDIGEPPPDGFVKPDGELPDVTDVAQDVPSSLDVSDAADVEPPDDIADSSDTALVDVPGDAEEDGGDGQATDAVHEDGGDAGADTTDAGADTTEPGADTTEPVDPLVPEEPFVVDGPITLRSAPRAAASADGWTWMCLEDGTLQTLDARPPASPPAIGQTAGVFRALPPVTLESPCNDVTIDRRKRKLWVAGDDGLTVLDVADPEDVGVVGNIETGTPVLVCVHDELWDWVYIVTRGPDGDRIVRLDASDATPGLELARTAPLPVPIQHLVTTPDHVVAVDAAGSVRACPRSRLQPELVTVDAPATASVGAAPAGADVLVAWSDRVVRLGPDEDGRFVSKGAVPAAPNAIARFHGRGGTAVCGCGPGFHGVTVFRTSIPGSPGSVETIGAMDGRRASLVHATPDGGAIVAWDTLVGRVDVPPFVTAFAPEPGTAEVRPPGAVEAFFSEPVVLEDGAVTLADDDGIDVPVTVQDGDGKVPSFVAIPNGPLAPLKRHVARCDRSIRDRHGLALWPADDAETDFETGPAHDAAPAERGCVAIDPDVVAIDAPADSDDIVACTKKGKLVQDKKPSHSVNPAERADRKTVAVPGACEDVVADPGRSRAYVALAENGVAVVDTSAETPRVEAVLRPHPSKPCRKLAGDLPAGKLFGVCGDALVEWDLGGSKSGQPVFERGKVDLGLAEGPVSLAVLPEYVAVVDDTGALGTVSRRTFEPADFAPDLYAPKGLGVAGSELLAATPGGSVRALKLDAEGRFEEARPVVELPGLRKMKGKGKYLGAAFDDGDVAILGRSERPGDGNGNGHAWAWGRLGEAHRYPGEAELVETEDGVVVAGRDSVCETDAPPFVVSTTPEDDATDVPLETAPVVRYSEPVDVPDGALTLWQGETEIEVAVASDGDTATLTPTAPLDADADHDLVIASTATDAAGQALEPAGGKTVRFRTVKPAPATCEDLDCGVLERDCDVVAGVATCGGCRSGYHESPQGTCAPDGCVDIDCGGDHRLCDESEPVARCTDCEPGYYEDLVTRVCAPYACGDLDCADANRRCDDSGDYAFCGGCLPGFRAEATGDVCVPLTCGDLDCELSHRVCEDGGPYAVCGGCLEGYYQDAAGDGACVPLGCGDIDCDARGRACDDSGPYAVCGGCLPGYTEIAGICSSPTCSDLGCAAQHLACDESGDVPTCGGCLPGYHLLGEECAPDTCADLDCAGLGRVCDETGETASCGRCLPGLHLAGGVCVPTTCADLNCSLWHRSCAVDGDGATCAACLAGYHESGSLCAPDSCAELDCGATLRVCDDSGPFAFCGGCETGYHDVAGVCVADGCADLDCAGQYRSCDDSGPFARCTGCLAGYHDDGDQCAPDGCEDADCATAHRACDESGPYATCGGCLAGYRLDGGVCVPNGCGDIDCAGAHRDCDDTGAYAFCGGCSLGHHEDGNGDCIPDTCGYLQCDERWRACDDSGPWAVCVGCLDGWHADGDDCAPDGCLDLDCAGQHRACVATVVPAECGGCVAGFEDQAGACVPDGCEDAGCAALHRECDPAGPGATCLVCLPGYEEVGGVCVPGPCLGLQCGPDGRGSTCGTCQQGAYCDDLGQCQPHGSVLPVVGAPRTIYLDLETLVPGREEPDMIVRPVVTIDGLTVAVTPDVAGIAPGDEILLVNQQGSAGATVQVGTTELHAVKDVDPAAATVTFFWPVEADFAPGGNDDLAGQKVVLIRVPHYDELVLPALTTLTATSWNGASGGVLAFAVDGRMGVESGAVVTMDERGYRGGAYGNGGCNNYTSCAHGQQGESIAGTGGRSGNPNVGGGGGGKTTRRNGGDWGDGGGGAAYLSPGSSGEGGTKPGAPHATHGPMRLLLGSGGGGGGADAADAGGDLHHGGNGARGGGVVHVRALALENGGAVRARGGDGNDVGSLPSSPGYEAGAGGAGAGGTVYLQAPRVAPEDGDCALVGGLTASEDAPAFADAGPYLAFTGAGQYADCGARSKLADGAAGWSIAAWFRRDSGQDAGWIYSEVDVDSAARVGLLVTADGRLRLEAVDGSGRSVALQSGAGAADDGDWHFATATHTGKVTRLFLDGRQVQSSVAAWGTLPVGATAIGARAGAVVDGLFGTGAIDEVATFARALPPDRVAALHYHATHDLQPWEPRLVQRQPTAFWRGVVDAGALANHADALDGLATVDVRGGRRSTTCRTACGGRGGDGRVVFVRARDDVEDDGFVDNDDTCFLARDPAQLDTNADGDGDLCEDDWDGDGVIDPYDAFPRDPDESADSDDDGVGDRADCRPADPLVWAPSCEGRLCGGDGCGGSCGSCDITQYCGAEWTCVDFDVQPPAVLTSGTYLLDRVSLTEGRVTPDMATYAVTGIEGARVDVTETVDAIGAGDEVLIINLQGAPDAFQQVGVSGRYYVASIEGTGGDTVVVLEQPVAEMFGPAGNLDFASQGQDVALLRIPHYAGLTLQSGAVLTASTWNGTTGGVLVFAVDGQMTIESGAQVSMDGRGYAAGRGGSGSCGNMTSCARGVQGEGIESLGAVSNVANYGGGLGGITVSNGGDWGTGGGGGDWYERDGGTPPRPLLRMGGGGGGGGADPQGWGDAANGTGGGRGGGIVVFSARGLTNAGSVRVQGSRGGAPGCTPGSAGNEPAGGGSGGSGTVYAVAPTAADATADCTPLGAPVVGVRGAVLDDDGATVFDGQADHALCGTTSRLGDGVGPWTMSAWFRAEPGAAGYLVSESGADPDADGMVGLALGRVAAGGQPGAVSVVASDPAGHAYVVTSPAGEALDDGAWHLAVATYAGGTFTVYVDGAPAATRAATLDPIPVAAVALAARPDGEDPFAGALDEVALFPIALDALQVERLFAASGAAGGPYEARVAEYGPSAYWRLGGLAAGVLPNAAVTFAEMGNVVVSGISRASCSCGCGGAGGDGVVFRSLGAGDLDGDGVPDAIDNCYAARNAAQEDLDGDGVGDACDPAPRTHPYGGSAAEPGASCADIRDTVPVPLDGPGWIDPDRDAPDGDGPAAPVEVWCDQTTDGGGWTLLLSYAHQGGTNDALVGAAFPLDPRGWSHVAALADFGFEADDVTELRFYCHSEQHESVLDFTTAAEAIRTAALTGDQLWQVADWTDAFTPAEAHSASLPAAADGVSTALDAGFTGAPFYADGVAGAAVFWAVQFEDDRWGCDDPAPGPNATTLHQVWFR